MGELSEEEGKIPQTRFQFSSDFRSGCFTGTLASDFFHRSTCRRVLRFRDRESTSPQFAYGNLNIVFSVRLLSARGKRLCFWQIKSVLFDYCLWSNFCIRNTHNEELVNANIYLFILFWKIIFEFIKCISWIYLLPLRLKTKFSFF